MKKNPTVKSTNGNLLCGKPHQRGQSLDKCETYVEELRIRWLKARRVLSEVYGCKVLRPTRSGDKPTCVQITEEVKEWMASGLSAIISGTKRLGRKERIGLINSVKSFKKALPDPCQCLRRSACDALRVKLTTPLPVPSDEYILYVERMTRKMFPVGWDSKYIKECTKNIPTQSSCSESSRRLGGARSYWKGVGDLGDYLEKLVDGEKIEDDLVFEYQEILTAGKLRPLTKTPAIMQLLRPLHKAMYDRLPDSWRLRGRAKLDLPGGWALSGDYKSATDNLSIEVAETILFNIVSRATTVPTHIRLLAMKSLRPSVKFPDGTTIKVKRGQMMGAFLSFPLLCLQNYFATSFALGRIPVKINGDDVVAILKKKDDSEKWFRLLPSLGLEPERTKTDVAYNYATINSTPFIFRNGVWKEVPMIRLKQFVVAPQGMSAIGRQLATVLNGFADKSCDVAKAFIRSHVGYLKRTNRSLVSLGFRGSAVFRASAQVAGLLRRQINEAAIESQRKPLPTEIVSSDLVPIHKEQVFDPLVLRVHRAQHLWETERAAKETELWQRVKDERPFGTSPPRSAVMIKMAKLLKGLKGPRFYYLRPVKNVSEACRLEHAAFLSTTPTTPSTEFVPASYAKLVDELRIRPPLKRFTPGGVVKGSLGD